MHSSELPITDWWDPEWDVYDVPSSPYDVQRPGEKAEALPEALFDAWWEAYDHTAEVAYIMTGSRWGWPDNLHARQLTQHAYPGQPATRTKPPVKPCCCRAQRDARPVRPRRQRKDRTVTDQAAYRRYTAEAERLAQLAAAPAEILAADPNASQASKAASANRAQALRADGWEHMIVTRLAGVYATLALAAAQERVQPADRPTGDGMRVNFISVHEELVRPTQAAFAHKVVMTDDKGRRWRIVAGEYTLLWEAIPV